jgi:hypothetical protein
MSAVAPQFSAAPAAAGYLYQARLALVLCIPYINTGSNVEVVIEGMDDISFLSAGEPIELLQVKHHIDRIANLSDSSPDLWKTLRIWATAASNDPSFPTRTRLVLLTTGCAPDGSIASLLRPLKAYPLGMNRDPDVAAVSLMNVASTSKNQALKPAFDAFISLTPEMRTALLASVTVIDRYQVLSDLDHVLESDLRLIAPSGKASQVREYLEGWWWPRVCTALMQSPPGPIEIAEVESKLDDIRDMLKRDSLVTEYEYVHPSDSELSEYDDFRFVKQLHAVGIGGNRISYAKRDYYRAFAQRSRWTREYAVLDGELQRFEQTLIEEWEPRFSSMCDSLTEKNADDSDLRQAGRELYQWVERDARFPIRSLTTRFLCVGSYNMLANDLRVGWHRDHVMLFSEDT